MNYLYNFLRSTFSNFSEITCLLCDNPILDSKKFICENCSLPKVISPYNRCQSCYELKNLCLCSRESYYNRLFFLWDYQDVQKTILNMKKPGNEVLAKYLSSILSKHLKEIETFTECDLIVAVPSSTEGLETRLYSPTKILAKSLSKELSIPYLNAAINKIGQNRQQKELSNQERRSGLYSNYLCRTKTVANRNIILVDDIITTGTTINNCCRALLEAGARKINVATLARTEIKYAT